MFFALADTFTAACFAVLAFAFLIPNPDEDSAKTSPGANASGSGSGTQGLQGIANRLAYLYSLASHRQSHLRRLVWSVCDAVNEDGAATTLGRNPPSHSNGRRLHYCARKVGTIHYTPTGGCGQCDGVCGPENGCQCRACYKLDH
jgi:hypothetical protein